MNPSRGQLYFHRLFSIEELGFRDPEPFIAPLIREFLRIGEAVAGRWIEMPFAVLVFQMVPGEPASGAIYLYDRLEHVFYMLCFDGPDDDLTLQEFEETLVDYNLLQYAEQPGLISRQRSPIPQRSVPQAPAPIPKQPVAFDLTAINGPRLTVKQGEWLPANPALRHVYFQTVGTA